MARFRIQTHGRLQEWVAEEKGYFTDDHLRIAAQFLECCTEERKAPVDAIREALAEGPAEALAWASGVAAEGCENG